MTALATPKGTPERREDTGINSKKLPPNVPPNDADEGRNANASTIRIGR